MTEKSEVKSGYGPSGAFQMSSRHAMEAKTEKSGMSQASGMQGVSGMQDPCRSGTNDKSVTQADRSMVTEKSGMMEKSSVPHVDKSAGYEKLPTKQATDTAPVTSTPYAGDFGVSRKVVIKAVEMEERMQVDAVKAADEALNENQTEQDVGRKIKLGFDNKYGPPWHCVVGRKFGSYVTHEAGYFIYFYIGNIAVLLFKAKD